MRRIPTENPLQVVRPGVQRLFGPTEDEIEADIGESGGASRAKGRFGVGRLVLAPQHT